jgi:hypothetical protein
MWQWWNVISAQVVGGSVLPPTTCADITTPDIRLHTSRISENLAEKRR